MARTASPCDRMLTLLESLGFLTEAAKTLIDAKLLNKGEVLLELDNDLSASRAAGTLGIRSQRWR